MILKSLGFGCDVVVYFSLVCQVAGLLIGLGAVAIFEIDVSLRGLFYVVVGFHFDLQCRSLLVAKNCFALRLFWVL
jgi:hypothetical protein